MLNATGTERSLAARIAWRKEFITRVVKFVSQLVLDRGYVAKREEGSSNIHSVQRLTNFAGFSFLCDWGQTMMGGNTVKVWYHPGEKMDEAPRSEPGIEYLMLDVSDQGGSFNGKECTVNRFVDKHAWQSALGRLIKNKGQIIAAEKRAAEVSGRRQKTETMRRQRLEQIHEEATRLGF